jgi:hypothetical protein
MKGDSHMEPDIVSKPFVVPWSPGGPQAAHTVQ